MKKSVKAFFLHPSTGPMVRMLIYSFIRLYACQFFSLDAE